MLSSFCRLLGVSTESNLNACMATSMALRFYQIRRISNSLGNWKKLTICAVTWVYIKNYVSD